MSIRLFAILKEESTDQKVRHYYGLPPDLSGQNDRQAMPHAKLVILEETEDGFFLYRYAANGVFAGDTWHESAEDAFHQAQKEYGLSADQWNEVPSNAKDSIGFALSKI